MHFKKRTPDAKRLKRLGREIPNQELLEKLLEDMPRDEAEQLALMLKSYLPFIPKI